MQIADEVTDVICEECGRNMVIKYARMVNSWRVLDSRSAVIPNRILRRLVLPARNAAKILYYVKPRRGRRYYGCENNPECDFMSWAKPSSEKCPKCGSYMVEKGQ